MANACLGPVLSCAISPMTLVLIALAVHSTDRQTNTQSDDNWYHTHASHVADIGIKIKSVVKDQRRSFFGAPKPIRTYTYSVSVYMCVGISSSATQVVSQFTCLDSSVNIQSSKPSVTRLRFAAATPFQIFVVHVATKQRASNKLSMRRV